MKARTKKLAALAALAAAVAAAIVIALIVKSSGPVSPRELVPVTWEAARTSPMHAAHVGKEKIACSECHTSGFQERASEKSCTKCHADAAAHAHRGAESAPTTCVTCHAFGAGKQAAACVDCHGPGAKAGPGAAASGTDASRAAHELARHVSKEAACGACHDVHGATKRARFVLPDCTACHTATSVSHGRVAVAPSGDANGGDGGESFDAAVSRFALDSRAAAGLRDGGDTRAGAVCSACHAPHAAGASARDACASCHVGAHRERAHPGGDAPSGHSLTAALAVQIEPRGRRVAGHEACVTCHEPHRAKKADTRGCDGCHADHRGAAAVSGHATCTGCHAPHAPAEARASCASATCHAGKTALAAPRVAAHAACESCHNPHKPAESPALACARCHGDVQPKHPGFKSKTADVSACIGCHAPHPPGNAAATATASTAAACSSCHKKAHDDRALHAGGVVCTKCHAPHAFGATVLAASPGKAHGASAPRVKADLAALCASCHGAKATAVAARPGHAECASCHGAAHSPAKKPSCAACHAQETASAPRGHAQCTQCHDAHSGAKKPDTSCTNCHAEKAKAQHASVPNGCASCHRPHGPKGVATPPVCSTCHAPAKLAGLHGISAHAANCASCHNSHAAPRSDRATCTSSCHVDRRDHQPAAKVCKGCHIFRH